MNPSRRPSAVGVVAVAVVVAVACGLACEPSPPVEVDGTTGPALGAGFFVASDGTVVPPPTTDAGSSGEAVDAGPPIAGPVGQSSDAGFLGAPLRAGEEPDAGATIGLLPRTAPFHRASGRRALATCARPPPPRARAVSAVGAPPLALLVGVRGTCPADLRAPEPPPRHARSECPLR